MKFKMKMLGSIAAVGLSFGLLGTAFASINHNNAIEADAAAGDVAAIYDFTTASFASTSYTSAWDYGDATIFGGANNNAGWNYVKMGGKSTNLSIANPVYVSSQKDSISKAIQKVTVSIIDGSLSHTGMSVNSWGLYVYSDSEMSTQIDYVAGGTITSSAADFDFTPTTGNVWAAGSYYKISWDLANTTTKNGIIYVDTISFIEGSAITDSEALDTFVSDYMHIDETTEGQCMTYYPPAKSAYNNLSSSQRSLFVTDSHYQTAYNRLVAWAAANGESIDSANDNVLGAKTSIFAADTSMETGSIAAGVIALVGIIALGGFLFYRKKKGLPE
ncbi:MAG: LPXTG cell wall anchor domain-containing protein [Bacilli bacterium]|jgi:LPXTG-motif cell wall-anchored protein|nr:LPXTG cell wall anchor domain-containing protein [Bacilli bacterium]